MAGLRGAGKIYFNVYDNGGVVVRYIVNLFMPGIS